MSRKFLYEFHEEAKIEEAKQRRTAEQIAYIPEETEALRGLGLVNRELGGSWGGAVPSSESPPWTRMPRSSKAGSRKQEALRAYEGERGYQPMLAVGQR